MRTDRLEGSLGCNDALVLDVNAQTGSAVRYIDDVIRATEQIEDVLGKHQALIIFTLGDRFASSSTALLLLVVGLGLELDLNIVILATGGLKVELDDQETEDHNPKSGKAQTDKDGDGVLQTVCGPKGQPVPREHRDDAAVEDTHDAKEVLSHAAERSEHAVDDEQAGRDEQEGEVKRLGNTAKHSGKGDGNEQSLDALLALGFGGHIKRNGDAKRAEDLSPTRAGIGSPGCGILKSNARIGSQLRQDVGPSSKDAAVDRRVVVIERRIDKVVQACRNQHALEESKDAHAERTGGKNESLEGGDSSLNMRPHQAGDKSDRNHNEETDHIDEHGTREHAQPLRKFGVEELVMQHRGDTRDNERAHDAHVKRFDACDSGKTSTAARLDRIVDTKDRAPLPQDCAYKVVEGKVDGQSLHAAASVLLVRERDWQRYAKQQRHLVKERPTTLEQHIPAIKPKMTRSGHLAKDRLGGKQRTQADDDSGKCEKNCRRVHCTAETLYLLHHDGESPSLHSERCGFGFTRDRRRAVCVYLVQ